MLFGHQNDTSTPANDDQAQANTGTGSADDGQNPLAVDPATGASLPVVGDSLEHAGEATLAEPEPQPAAVLPPMPPTDDVPAPNSDTSLGQPADNTPANADELLDLKQQALQQLGPLVGHLDQTPEEKFRTTMMMIQSSDNQALIKDAYAAAQAITDDKARAQALLDIINEINYFTHHSNS
jgi:hypothetical protein